MTSEGSFPKEGWREEHLAYLWRNQRLLDGKVSTLDGQELQVIYPGRRNRGEGPDFKGAILARSGGELIRGDVEVHLRARDWNAHGHGQDGLYRNVILHVLLWDKGEQALLLPGGGTAPTVALAPLIGQQGPEIVLGPPQAPLLLEPCNDAEERVGETWLDALDNAGDARFTAKAAQCEGDLSLFSPQDVLFRGIMKALGYGGNSQAFLGLAELLPWGTMTGMVQGKPSQERHLHLQALLLGMAGLLPSQRPKRDWTGGAGPLAEALESLWFGYNPGASEVLLGWRLYQVRPANHPLRRIVGAAYLVSRATDQGLLEYFLRLLLTKDVDEARHRLEESLMVQGGDYWSTHWDFGKTFKGGALIGKDRAREIAINALLPFFLAWSRQINDKILEEKVWDLYRRFPAAGDNQVTREMARQLSPEGKARISSARRQQGLIHLYKTRCLGMKCQGCPFARAGSHLAHLK